MEDVPSLLLTWRSNSNAIVKFPSHHNPFPDEGDTSDVSSLKTDREVKDSNMEERGVEDISDISTKEEDREMKDTFNI